MASWLGSGLIVSAQDASAIADRQAAEERYQSLVGKVQDLAAANDLLQKRVNQLEGDLKAAREEQGKVNPDVVGRDELKQLAQKVKEIDEKRAADKELILKEIERLGQTPAVPPTTSSKKPKVKKAADTADTTTPADNPPAAGDKTYEGFEYVIKDGDTLSKIVAGCQKQGVKVTVSQILKHPLNSKLDPNKLIVGHKIFIPAPAK